ncbi:MAG: right-handed parallel beta-helix repeat-containing protein [Acidobacteriota bacterium]|nr:MAG: right-handed parallel beta-helix repeat-containing protein [Acidobacteriota bacterium]
MSSGSGTSKIDKSLLARGWVVVFLAVMLPGSLMFGTSATTAVGRITQAENSNPAQIQEPRVFLDTSYSTTGATGKTIIVPADGDFQDALFQAQPGDVISLEAGATYVGNFVLPGKPGNEWIVVRSSAADKSLPPPGVRITPSQAGLLPKIVSPNDKPALTAISRAHHFRFIGIEFTMAPGVRHCYNLILLGADEKTTAEVPHHLIFDRVYIHGRPDAALRRGIALNSSFTAVIDSYISECHESDADSQAIMGWNGPGPYKIVNNYLEASGENIMFGGADPLIPDLIPSDIEIRRNHCYKPTRWRVGSPDYGGKHWSVKNLFELKNAQRVLIQGNVFENNWADAQNGAAILFTVRNQDGSAPWSVVRDVAFTGNVVKNAASVFNLLGRDDNHPSGAARGFNISNNLFSGIDGKKWGGGSGAFIQIGAVADVTVRHNTVQQTGNAIFANRGPSGRFVFTDNIVFHNQYGIIGDDHGTGNDSIRHYFPDGVFRKNVIIGGKSDSYPPENYFPESPDIVRFADPGKNDFRLSNSSPYRNLSTEGKDIGCNPDLLEMTGSVTSTQ